MATLYVRNLPDDLYKRLQQLAASQHRSINAQAIALLEQALPPQTQQDKSETPKPIKEILAESRRRREQLRTDVEWPDSTAMSQEDRER